jgi:ornithine cyclodeaminase
MKIVEEKTLRKLVGEAAALEAVRVAFSALASGRVIQPPPMGMDLEEIQGEVHVKGAYLKGEPTFAMKVASGFYQNAAAGLPTGSGLVLVFDATSGFPLALLRDNGYLTELRTGGAGALAVHLLAPERPLNVGVIGAGSQARYQLRAVAQVRSLREVRVWGPLSDEVERYVQEMAGTLGIPVLGVGTPRESVESADLVITVTPSREAIVEAGWLRGGATVVAVGSDGPEKQELAVEVLGQAGKVVVDSLSQCLNLGETHHAVAAGVLKPEGVYAELGEILLGRKAAREGGELIVVDLTGVGAQDAAMAGVVWGLLEQD